MKRNILLASANPRDTMRLELDEELRQIEQVLKMADKRGQYVLKTKLALREEDLLQSLLDDAPYIVFFSGHGNKEKGITFAGEDAKTELISADKLCGIFAHFADSVKCVILNACHSARQAEAIVKHIDFVIGMDSSIKDKNALNFAVNFFRVLGAGRNFRKAYEIGVSMMDHQQDIVHFYEKSSCLSVPVKKGDNSEKLFNNLTYLHRAGNHCYLEIKKYQTVRQWRGSETSRDLMLHPKEYPGFRLGDKVNICYSFIPAEKGIPGVRHEGYVRDMAFVSKQGHSSTPLPRLPGAKQAVLTERMEVIIFDFGTTGNLSVFLPADISVANALYEFPPAGDELYLELRGKTGREMVYILVARCSLGIKARLGFERELGKNIFGKEEAEKIIPRLGKMLEVAPPGSWAVSKFEFEIIDF